MLRDVVGEDVAQQPLHEAQLAVQEGGRALARGLRAHLVPGAREEAHVALEVLLAVAGPHRARDEPAAPALLAQVLEDRLQPAPLLVVHDLARDADVLDGRHEDEIAAGQGHVGGDARPLLAERLLDHLHEHFLSRLEHLLDGGRPVVVRGGGGPAARAVAGRRGFLARGRARVAGGRRPPRLLGGEEVLVELLDDVGHVEERVALLADVDERGLHPGEDPGHLPLIEVSDDAAVGFPLDEDLGDDSVVQERDLGLLGGAADDEVLGHGRSLP